jgi:hypothetical protein
LRAGPFSITGPTSGVNLAGLTAKATHAVRADGATGADDGPLVSQNQRTDAGRPADCHLVLHFGETCAVKTDIGKSLFEQVHNYSFLTKTSLRLVRYTARGLRMTPIVSFQAIGELLHAGLDGELVGAQVNIRRLGRPISTVQRKRGRRRMEGFAGQVQHDRATHASGKLIFRRSFYSDG